jgi:hypothetical protein
MAHDYLLETYTYIEQRLTRAKQKLVDTRENPYDRQYASGQVKALCDFERFLIKNFNAKLPRRLRR